MIRTLLVILVLQIVCQSAWARPAILELWEEIYPASPDALRNCQLCHEMPSGGDGWNPYGWRLRQLITENGFTREAAILDVELDDSDSDVADSDNLLEIESGTQPGWRVGSSNRIRYEDNSSIFISADPTITDPLILSNLDLPSPVTNPFPTRVPIGAEGATETIASGMLNAEVTLTSPIFATYAPGLDGYLFVADQIGRIYKIDLDNPDNSVIFIDISSFIQQLSSGYDERGLLGFAFHPNFSSNGLFYTYHSEPAGVGTSDFPLDNVNHKSVVSEWTAINPGDSSTLGMTAPKRDLLRIDQPRSNHNGGAIVFDSNNYLLIALGDGGGQDDGFGNGNNPLTPLGSVLRIDPSGMSGTMSANNQYSIPGDNPFVGDAEKLNEAFAFGFRNPYTLTRDRVTNHIYSGDVGQNDIEEINRVTSGGNFGWNAKEGSFYFYTNGGQSGFVSSRPSTRADNTMIDPILEYDRDDGISAVGGPVYRGDLLPQLNGAYLFADWAGTGSEGRLFFSPDFVTENEVQIDGASGLNMYLTGFGEDSDGEVYLLGKTELGPSGSTGMIKKLTEIELVEPVSGDEELCFPIAGANGKTAVICI